MSDHLELVIPPTVEPVTLDQAKEYLRVDYADEDALIGGLITTARVTCGVLLRQSILVSTYDWFLDGFPAGGGYYNRAVRAAGLGPGWLPGGDAPLCLPNPPLVSVESVKYYDATGELVTLPADAYVVSTGFGARIQPSGVSAWPVAAPRMDAVVIRYTAGRATVADVPAPVTAAILLLVGHWFENRDTVVVGTIVNRLPDAVDQLLAAVDHGSYS